MKRIYRVKITYCSLNFMWYRNHIGEEYDCEVVINKDTYFAPYTMDHMSYKCIKPVKTNLEIKAEKVTLPNGAEKMIYFKEAKLIPVELTGWILEEDCEVLDIKEVYNQSNML